MRAHLAVTIRAILGHKIKLFLANLRSLSVHVYSYQEALKDLDASLKNLRGNLLIDYKQLGLQYKLYSCEVSRAVALLYGETVLLVGQIL